MIARAQLAACPSRLRSRTTGAMRRGPRRSNWPCIPCSAASRCPIQAELPRFLRKRSSRRRRMTKNQNNPDNPHPGSCYEREADDDQACIRNRDPGIRPASLRARCGMDASPTRRRIDDRQRPERGAGRERLTSTRHGCRSHRGLTERSRQPECVNLEEPAPPLNPTQLT
jgi:hypothetical protein